MLSAYLVSYLRGKCSSDSDSVILVTSSEVFLLLSPPSSTRPRSVLQAQCSWRGWRRLEARLQETLVRWTQVKIASPTWIPEDMPPYPGLGSSSPNMIIYTGSFTIADQKNWCIVNDPVCYQCHRPWALTGCGPLCHEASQAESTMSCHQARGAQQSCSPGSPPSRLQPHNIEDHWHSKMSWLSLAVRCSILLTSLSRVTR